MRLFNRLARQLEFFVYPDAPRACGSPPRPSPWALRLAVWALALLALEVAGARWPSHQDGRAMARALREDGVETSVQLVAVDTPRNALALYGYDRIVQLATGGHEIYFAPILSLDEGLGRILAAESVIVFIARPGPRARVVDALAGTPFRCELLPGPFEYDILECRDPGRG